MRRQLERNAIFLAAVMLVLGAFEFLICAMVGSFDVEVMFSQLSASMPPLFRAMIEQNMLGGTPAGVLSFGWNHPVAHALLASVAITLPAQAIAGEVESGAIELVMAQPLSRGSYFLAHLAAGACALAVVLAGGIAGTALGQLVYGLDPFGWRRLAALFANGLALQLAIYSLTLVASSLGREAGRAALAGVLVAVISYLVNAVATLWTKARFLEPYSLHHYFDPHALLVKAEPSAGPVVTLVLLTAAAIGLAFAVFARRDLP